MAVRYLTVQDAKAYLNHVRAGWADGPAADAAIQTAIETAEEMFDQRASTRWESTAETHTAEASGDHAELLLPRCQSVASVRKVGDTSDVDWPYVLRSETRKGERSVYGILRTDGQPIPAGYYDIEGMFGWASPPARMIYGLKRQTARIYQDRTSYGPVTPEQAAARAGGGATRGERLEWDLTAMQICDDLGDTDTIY